MTSDESSPFRSLFPVLTVVDSRRYESQGILSPLFLLGFTLGGLLASVFNLPRETYKGAESRVADASHGTSHPLLPASLTGGSLLRHRKTFLAFLHTFAGAPAPLCPLHPLGTIVLKPTVPGLFFLVIIKEPQNANARCPQITEFTGALSTCKFFGVFFFFFKERLKFI